MGDAPQTHALGEEVVDEGVVGTGLFGELGGRVVSAPPRYVLSASTAMAQQRPYVQRPIRSAWFGAGSSACDFSSLWRVNLPYSEALSAVLSCH